MRGARVRLKWLTPEEGGRARPFIGDKYVATARFPRENEPFSVVLRFVVAKLPNPHVGTLGLLCPDLVDIQARISPGADLDIMEGARTVAHCQVVSETQEILEGMEESHFWVALEFRICGELSGMENDLRSWWCDGVLPEQYLLDGPSPCITGSIWIWMGQSSAEQWKFKLFLSYPVRSVSEIQWHRLLPPEEMTRWLAVDRLNKRIEIEPLAAVPDGT